MGLGETVVGGTTVPEVVEVRPTDDGWAVRRTRPLRQVSAIVVEDGAVRQADAEGATAGRAPLAGPVARAIGSAVAELQWNLSRPLDVEWAVEGDRLWWLQVRPQTRPLDGSPRRPIRPGLRCSRAQPG